MITINVGFHQVISYKQIYSKFTGSSKTDKGKVTRVDHISYISYEDSAKKDHTYFKSKCSPILQY